MKTVLITGANRGIGLEFCKQYAKSGNQVFACCRQPNLAIELNQLASEYPQVRVLEMDVLDRKGIDELSEKLGNFSLDILIANAGVYGDSSEHQFGNLNYADWIKTLEINLLGVAKVTETFLANLKRSKQPRIAALSSQMGSINDNTSGGSILYRSSKAALNAMMKSLSIDLQNKGIGVLTFHPGWVQTDMGGVHALINTETSVAGMIQQIKDFKISQTGSFIKYDGTQIPW